MGFPQVLVIGNSTAVYVGFSGDSDSKESASNAGDLSLIPGSGRSPREGNGNPLACSILAWRIPRVEEPGRYSPGCSKELDTTKGLILSLFHCSVCTYMHMSCN